MHMRITHNIGFLLLGHLAHPVRADWIVQLELCGPWRNYGNPCHCSRHIYPAGTLEHSHLITWLGGFQ